MKRFIFLYIFFSPISIFGQSPVDKIMSKATCDCISSLLNPAGQDKKAFNECFLNAVGINKGLLTKECLALYGDTTNEAFYKFGDDFFNRNSVNLIYSCDAYYEILDSARYLQINSLNKDSIHALIKSLNITEPQTWDKAFLLRRGLFYFAVNDYNNAMNDLNASLALDPTITQSIFFKAWIFEIGKNYDEAIKLYNDLAVLTKEKNYNILAAIANRKKSNR